MLLNRIAAITLESALDFFPRYVAVRDNDNQAFLALKWLIKAQQVTGDNGVSAYYSIVNGWAPSFIETTGYILGTFLHYDSIFPELDLQKKAQKMGDFLISMQLKNGGFRAYPPSSGRLSQPIIFNTGQDALGVADLFFLTRRSTYEKSMIKASDYLLKEQNGDGSWTEKHYDQQTHAYHSRVAWALAKAYHLSGRKKYSVAAQKNLDWTLSLQQRNGWFDRAILPGFNATEPITHTISYTIEGLFWSGLLLKKDVYIDSALRSLTALSNLYKDGMLWATYDQAWQPTSRYVCLTGAAQIAASWLAAYALTGEKKYLRSGEQLLNWVKKKQTHSVLDPNLNGAIAGSYPLSGDLLAQKGYCRLAYPNWATKFFLDALYMNKIATSYDKNKKIIKGVYVIS